MVTPLVKSFILPTTLEEKLWTPFTTEAAKSEPGRCGREAGVEVEAVPWLVIAVLLLEKPGE